MKLVNHPIFVVLAVAVLAPLLAEMRIGVPVVVLEVLLGIVVGPHMLGIVEPGVVLLVMKTAGAGVVLFMAGMEIDFSRIRGRPLSLALRGWVASLGLGLVGLLHVIPDVQAPMMVAVALATTGLGTLLPILRDGGQLDAPFGRLLLAAGTVGEVGPIVAVSLTLSTQYGTWQTFGFLVAFLALVALAAAVGVGARPPKLLALLSRTLNASTQWPVRLVLLLLAGSMLLALELGFEAILGAFAMGMVVGLATRGKDGESFRAKIDAVSFGWFAPFFFVGTGIYFDLGALTRDVKTMLLIPTFLALFLIVRGLPVFLYRIDLPRPQRPPFALFASVASLPLIVVMTEIGLRAGHIGYCTGANWRRRVFSVDLSDARRSPVVEDRGVAHKCLFEVTPWRRGRKTAEGSR